MNQQKPTDFVIGPEAIRAQMGKILASEAFVRSPRMQRFLAFIVEETLAGRTDQLGEYSIGTAVFDRGQDFEPALDPIVRNDARRLRLKLLEYYRQTPSRSTGEVLIDVPKGGYVPVFLRPSTHDENKLAPPDRTRRLAVLPFEVLPLAPENALHSRLLCLSLTAGLTNIHGLETVAHGYLRDLPIREMAAELRLSHVIHGSVLKTNGRCHVIVNFIHVPDGTQLWAREYDLESGDMLAFPGEITVTVLREVTACLGLGRQQHLPLARAA